jgi:hypothetical protein
MGLMKTIQPLLLGFVVCFCLLVGLGQAPLLATNLTGARPISPAGMPIIPGETVDLATGVDRFLTSMPAGYYTIANVEGLKNQLKKTQPCWWMCENLLNIGQDIFPTRLIFPSEP